MLLSRIPAQPSPSAQPSPVYLRSALNDVLQQTTCKLSSQSPYKQSLSQTYVFPLPDLSPLGNSGEKYIAS